MKIHLTVSEEERLIIIKTCGQRDYAQILEGAKDTLALAANHGFEKMIVDHRQAVITASTAEIYQLPQALKTFGLTGKHRTAIIYSGKADDEWPHQILAAAAAEFGFQIRAFDKLSEALFWLGVQSTGLLSTQAQESILSAA